MISARESGSAVTIAAVVLAVVALCGGIARAQVGERNFIEPLVTEDPNPSNEIDLMPGWVRGSSGSDLSFSFDVEKQLSDDISLMVADSFNDPTKRRLRATTGWSNLQILGKWAFFESDEHEARLAIGPDIFAPTGEIAAGANGHPRGGPILMMAKGMGDLATDGFFRYLRPFAIQADAAYIPTWSGYESDIAQSDVTLSYQFYYLADSGVELPLAYVTKHLAPFIEFNYQQIVGGRSNRTPPDFLITPAIAYQTDAMQLTIGGQLGLNGYAHENAKAGVVGMLSLQMDKIVPAVGWTPF